MNMGKKSSYLDEEFKSTSDGWRGKIADSFTFELVSKVASAISQYILSKKVSKKSILISYDSRFLSKSFAKRMAEVFSSHGIQPLLDRVPLPTPVLSFRVKQKGFFCGVTVTASHNPYWYNGIKIRMGYGGPPNTEVMDSITELISSSRPPVLRSTLSVISDDPLEGYIREVRKLLDMDLFRDCSLRILVDSMHGTTAGLLQKLFSGTGVIINEINNDHDPYFGNVPPEPRAHNTLELQKKVSDCGYDLGVAHDGDGDRIVGVIPSVGFLSPHDIVAILLWYLVTVKKQKGMVVGSVTLSRRVARLADYFNLEYREVPVGFRNACQVMRDEKVLIAGEENGGIGFGFYLPERDGTVAAALLAEAELKCKGGIREILRQITEIAGPAGFCRLDLKVSYDRESLIKRLKINPPKGLLGQIVERVDNIDGVKFCLCNGDWVNVRASGTEDLIRIYAESNNNKLASRLVKEMEIIIKKIIGGKGC